MKGPTSSINGTGHVLQDLLGSTVRLDRSNFPKSLSSSLPKQGENLSTNHNARCKNLSSKVNCCFVCSETTNLSPIAIEEMNILVKFVLTPEQLSLILLTQDHPPIFCCKICSSTILSLMKLKTEIENITTCLRAVISSRGGLFDPLDKNITINESTKEDLNNSFHCNEFLTRSKLSHVQEQLTGCVEEEDFFIKIESTEEDGNDYDPLEVYEPEAMEDYDSVANSLKSESDLNAESAANSAIKSKLECEKCKITFSRPQHLRRHMKNKNIHPVPRKALDQFSHRNRKLPRNLKTMSQIYNTASRPTCVTCDKTFTSISHLRRHIELIHFTDKTFCPYGCPLKLETEADWVTHLEQCNSTKMSNTSGCICRHCRVSFRNIFLRMEHSVRLHKDKMYPCLDCKHIFSSKDVLDRHVRARHSTAFTSRLENVC